jgi:hypothetical protein
MSEHLNDTEDEWEIVESDGDLAIKGMSIQVDKATGQMVSLSARHTKDADRWLTMPSLEHYSASLKDLDLHKSRYLIELDPSVCSMIHLERLILTRCDRLRTLPRDIGQLTNLKEVKFGIAAGEEHKSTYLINLVLSFYT